MKKTKKNELRFWDHAKENWRLYVIVAVVLGSLVLSGNAYQVALNKSKAIASWPSTSGKIESSQVSVNPAPPPNKFTVTVALDIAYSVAGRPLETRYVKTWSTSKDYDYEKLLAQGKIVNLKYSPSDPSAVSLDPIAP